MYDYRNWLMINVSVRTPCSDDRSFTYSTYLLTGHGEVSEKATVSSIIVFNRISLQRGAKVTRITLSVSPTSLHITTNSLFSHSVTEVRVLQIRCVDLAEFSPKTLLFLLTDPALGGLLITAAVLPYVVEPPADDQNEFQPERHCGSDGSGN